MGVTLVCVTYIKTKMIFALTGRLLQWKGYIVYVCMYVRDWMGDRRVTGSSCVCVCVCIYIYMYVCMYVRDWMGDRRVTSSSCVCVYIYVCMYVCM
jgi:hypothetical protein